jgi:hypothetical protein
MPSQACKSRSAAMKAVAPVILRRRLRWEVESRAVCRPIRAKAVARLDRGPGHPLEAHPGGGKSTKC